MPLKSPRDYIHLLDLATGIAYCNISMDGMRIKQFFDYNVTCENCIKAFKIRNFGVGGTADLSGQDHKYAEGFAAGVKSVEGAMVDRERDTELEEFNGASIDPKWNDKTKLDRATGVKYDQDKLRYDLISPVSNEATAKVLTYGSKKYNDRNWENGIAYSRLYRAALGHLQDFWRRNDIDSESNLRHLDHAAANIHMLQHLSIVGPKMDDRPKYNPVADDGGLTPSSLAHYKDGDRTLCGIKAASKPLYQMCAVFNENVTCPACIQLTPKV